MHASWANGQRRICICESGFGSQTLLWNKTGVRNRVAVQGRSMAFGSEEVA